MPAVLSHRIQRSIRNRGMQALYGIAADNDVDVSDVLDLLVTTSMTKISGDLSPFVRLPVTTPLADLIPDTGNMVESPPSQPAEPSHAPAAQTDEGVRSSSLATSSVDPDTSVGETADGQAHHDTDEGTTPPDDVSDAAPTSLPGAESAVDQAPIRGRKRPVRSRVAECHRDNPSWPAKLIAQHLKVHEVSVRTAALEEGIKLPTWWAYQRSLQNAVTEALKAIPAVKKEPDAIVEPPPVKRVPRNGKLEREQRIAEIVGIRQAEPDLSSVQIGKRLGLSAQYVRDLSAVGGHPFKSTGPSIRQRVSEVYAQHPDWGANQIAEHLGLKPGSVFYPLRELQAAADALEAAPAPLPTPQTPVSPPPPPTGGTLTQRVTIMHQQRPTWTARMIAQELGADTGSVQTLLAKARKAVLPPEPGAQQFTGLADLQSHYSSVAQRLGKVGATKPRTDPEGVHADDVTHLIGARP